jgi:hypothetical protein
MPSLTNQPEALPDDPKRSTEDLTPTGPVVSS